MTDKEKAEFIAEVIRRWGHFGKGINATMILEKCRNQKELDRWFCQCMKFRKV